MADLGVERADFVGIPVTDLERSKEFYGGTLGLTPNPNAAGRWVEYEIGNVSLALVSPTALGLAFEPQGHQMPIALRVSDVEEAMGKLEADGVEFQGGLIDSGVCHMANFKDPDGNSLQLHCRYAPFADGSLP